MGKIAGEPYDPRLRKTEHGARLYGAWKTVRSSSHCEEWDWFPAFYEWAMSGGYTLGAWLRKIDKTKPYCPENCVWRPAHYSESETAVETKTFINNWNKSVNRIRRCCGLPPLEGTHYGDI